MWCPVLLTFKDGHAFNIIATDNEGDTLEYSINGQNARFFNVNKDTGEVTIKSRLDREVGVLLLLEDFPHIFFLIFEPSLCLNNFKHFLYCFSLTL